MRKQVYESCIALKIVAQVSVIVDDPLQVIDGGFVVPTPEIEYRNLVIKHENAMPVDEQRIFLHPFLDIRHKCKPFLECARHRMFVDACTGNVDEGLNSKIIMLHHSRRLSKLFEFPKCGFKL